MSDNRVRVQGAKKLIAGSMVIATGSAMVPMTGCEPVTTGVVVVATTVANITLEQLLLWAAQGLVGWVAMEIGETIYINIADAVSGDSAPHQLQPGDLLKYNEDGTFTKL